MQGCPKKSDYPKDELHETGWHVGRHSPLINISDLIRCLFTCWAGRPSDTSLRRCKILNDDTKTGPGNPGSRNSSRHLLLLGYHYDPACSQIGMLHCTVRTLHGTSPCIRMKPRIDADQVRRLAQQTDHVTCAINVKAMSQARWIVCKPCLGISKIVGVRISGSSRGTVLL